MVHCSPNSTYHSRPLLTLLDSCQNYVADECPQSSMGKKEWRAELSLSVLPLSHWRPWTCQSSCETEVQLIIYKVVQKIANMDKKRVNRHVLSAPLKTIYTFPPSKFLEMSVSVELSFREKYFILYTFKMKNQPLDTVYLFHFIFVAVQVQVFFLILACVFTSLFRCYNISRCQIYYLRLA